MMLLLVLFSKTKSVFRFLHISISPTQLHLESDATGTTITKAAQPGMSSPSLAFPQSVLNFLSNNRQCVVDRKMNEYQLSYCVLNDVRATVSVPSKRKVTYIFVFSLALLSTLLFLLFSLIPKLFCSSKV